jgi:hypothetical protein
MQPAALQVLKKEMKRSPRSIHTKMKKSNCLQSSSNNLRQTKKPGTTSSRLQLHTEELNNLGDACKAEATQIKRLQQLMADSEAGTNQWKDNKYIKNKVLLKSIRLLFSFPRLNS